MRRTDKELRDTADINAVIAGNSVCRLAMADGSRPYVIPMNYGFSDSRFYLHSALEGRKLDVIRTNANVCIEVTDSVKPVVAEKACSFSMKYRSVVMDGVATIVDDPAEKVKGLQLILSSLTGDADWEMPASSVAGVAVIRVDVLSFSGKASL